MKQSASGDLLLWDVTLNFGRGAVCVNWNERYVCGEPECLPRNGSAADDRKSASNNQSFYGQAGKAASMELRRKAKPVNFSHI
ncbi:hypothetical protein T03_12507 [Trichinella britovi]|uniref:Uncharacterized protein n=1 Tax=Trichinella britovi TaxID=45882 RepID=A0A0V1AIT7_TRIBR|nr:hypothetical protein T03_12507 [Trichinella britovi]